MKKIILSAWLMAMLCNLLNAQAPQQFNYQAVVRDKDGIALAGKTPVALRFTIRNLDANGEAVFTELQKTTTNKMGLVNLQIGSAADLSLVNWENGAKYLQVELDADNSGTFTDMGTAQLLSVPYALHAASAGSDHSLKSTSNTLNWNCTTHTLTVNGKSTVIANCDGTFGATGPTGAKGATGATGAAGSKGSTGATGAAGPQGIQGVKGTTGATGLQGQAGANGATGATGVQGTKGNTGPQGDVGVTGANGAKGDKGDAGAAGTQGIQGVQGATGAAGNDGVNGQNGAQGNPGITGATGAGGPTGLVQNGNSTGDILYWNGSSWAVLPIGSAGQVLTVNETGLPAWAAAQNPKQLTTTTISAITYFTASSGGSITNDGGHPITARGVCWSTSPHPTIANSLTTDGSGVGTYSSSLTGLLAGTTYYVRAYATNSDGTGYGNEITFSSVAPSLPTITTSAVTGIISYQALGGGSISNDNGAPVTARGICFSTSPSPTLADGVVSNGTGLGGYTCLMANLDSGTTYYVRAYATNTAGTAYGNELSFVANLGPGEAYQGGLIAYIFKSTDPGYVAGEIHGYVIAGATLSLAPAGCRGTVIGTSTAFGTGQANTNAILAGCPTAGIAARIADDFVSGIYTDWYLPSLDDWNAIYPNKNAIGGFWGYYYSSSSEAPLNAAQAIVSKDFAQGNQPGAFKDASIYVRPIRNF